MQLDKEEFTEVLISCLSKDLLKKSFIPDKEAHITTGHCYISCEVIYHTFGDKDEWSSYAGKDSNGITHWWLKNKHTGEIFDPTKEQYTSLGLNPPYDKGRACGFLTREPSKRAQVLIQRINSLINNSNQNDDKKRHLI